LTSVISQTYYNIELIIIDDCSEDKSAELIDRFVRKNPETQFIVNDSNVGLCASFNRGLKLSKGKYVIDLSADDVLLPDRVERQIRFFESLPSDFGVIFSNAQYINEQGSHDHNFYQADALGKAMPPPASGDIYKQLVDTYFISAPTMMMRRETLVQFDGYDETLSYEDFDFWIRSSRDWKYAYQDEILTKVRMTSGSLSDRYYHQHDDQLMATYRVCQKIRKLNRTTEEDVALIKRLEYEIKHAVFANKKKEANLFLGLLRDMQPLSLTQKFLRQLNKTPLNTSWLRDLVVNMQAKA